MYNYYMSEAKETFKRTVAIAGAAAVITAGTYGGSKIGHAVVDSMEDIATSGAKALGKAIKKKIKKKKFGFF